MAFDEIAVEDYLNDASIIGDTDLFDLTINIGGGNFRSDKLSFAVLKLIFLGVRRFKVTRSFNDFATAALTNTLLIFTIPAGFELVKRTTKHDTSWTGGGATFVEVQEGILGELDRYSPGGPLDIFQSVGDIPDKFDHTVLNFLESFGVGTDLRSTVTSDVDLDQLTQGDIQYIFYLDQIK